MLEPQHHLLPVLQRLDQLPVPILQRGQDRPPAPPAARGEERRAGLEQLAPRPGWHRPLVQHVLPGQHRAAQRGLAQRVPRAVAVGDVQRRRARRRDAAAPGQVRRAAGAVVQRLARAADDPRELVPHPAQPGDAGVDLVDLRRGPGPQRRRGGSAPGDAQVLLDLGQGEADRLRLLDGAEEAHRVLVVVPVPARRAGRLGQQSAALVVAQGRGVDAGPPRGLSRSHVSTINPHPGAGINQDGQAGGAGGRAPTALTLPH